MAVLHLIRNFVDENGERQSGGYCGAEKRQIPWILPSGRTKSRTNTTRFWSKVTCKRCLRKRQKNGL